jgi:hypothetical protein
VGSGRSVEEIMRKRASRRRASYATISAVLAITVALGVGSSTHAEEGKWSIQLEPMYMDAYGHDQHVLTIHEIDFGPPSLDVKTGVTLDTKSDTAIRGELQYSMNRWSWGMDFFWFISSQDTDSPTAAADGPAGPIDEVIFEAADQAYSSTDPSEVLFYEVLEDTDIATWTVDFYGMRKLTDKSDSGVYLQLGLRFADFDNDYRAVVGIEDDQGTRFDASSNYDRMTGPLIGLSGDVTLGRNYIQGYVGQSVLLGTATLTNRARDFTGTFSDTVTFDSEEMLRKDQDVAIPVTELRIKWTYRVNKFLALGLGANTSAWWDVPVPPGVVPIEGGDGVFLENTFVYFGMAGVVELTF